MALLNPDTHDLQIIVTADKRKGLWASSLFVHTGRSLRTGGQLPTTASAHTLLLVALTNTLRGISRNQYQKLVNHLPEGITKPRVSVVVVGDQTFAPALSGLIKGDRSVRCRAGRNWLTIAAQQIARFSLTIESSDDKRDLALQAWVQKNLYPIPGFEQLPAVLVPSLTSQVVNHIF
jgi:hypothetical protein